jgi:KipI family sensor histidine kinase inhibitor
MLSAREYRILTAGDCAVVVEFGEGIDRAISAKVHALDRALARCGHAAIRELVPTFRSLMIHFEPLDLSHANLVDLIATAAAEAEVESGVGRAWLLPVCYDVDMGPDLPFVAERVGYAPADVIAAHAACRFHVYMLGFLPGQAYMGDNPLDLILPRRETPRLSIPAGSVAIAMGMTSIFPQVTPCGWHLIGRCPVPMWDVSRSDAPLLRADDSVRFVPVTSVEYRRIQGGLAERDDDLTPELLADLLP